MLSFEEPIYQKKSEVLHVDPSTERVDITTNRAIAGLLFMLRQAVTMHESVIKIKFNGIESGILCAYQSRADETFRS